MRFKFNNRLKKISVDKNSSFYDTEYPSDFPVGNYYVDKYKTLPSFYDSKYKYKLNVVDYFVKQQYDTIWSYKRANTEGGPSPIIDVFEKEGTIVMVRYKEPGRHGSRNISLEDYISDTDTSSNVEYASLSIYYNDISVLEAINKGLKKYVNPDKSKAKISLVTSSRGGLDLVQQDIKAVEVDISMNYGTEFKPVHEKIVQKLNEDKGKGLVLLHGVPGTGKTNYIRHLCGEIKKDIIFLPPFMAENIASPDFITFLLEHTNSILVIEDAEKVVLDREGENSSRQSVANLLNITDGILSDCLSIQIIATFNTSRDRIDKALLRKGRLIAEWKFDALSVEDSNNLLKSLGSDFVTNKPMTLTEIYNVDEEEFIIQKERNQIGFGK